jgi:hypothetical protein
VQQILDAITEAPVYIRNGRRDVLATNPLGRAPYSELFTSPDRHRPVNIRRFVFLDPRASTFFVHWPTVANDTVAALRIEAGKNPYDRALTDLVGELSTRSDEFATRWASQDVHFHRSGRKDFHHHAVVGDLFLNLEAMDLPADPGLSLVIYSARPDTPTNDALRLLASWAASTQQTDAVAHYN